MLWVVYLPSQGCRVGRGNAGRPKEGGRNMGVGHLLKWQGITSKTVSAFISIGPTMVTSLHIFTINRVPNTFTIVLWTKSILYLNHEPSLSIQFFFRKPVLLEKLLFQRVRRQMRSLWNLLRR